MKLGLLSIVTAVSALILSGPVSAQDIPGEYLFSTYRCNPSDISGVSNTSLSQNLDNFCQDAPQGESSCTNDVAKAENYRNVGRIEQCDTVFYCEFLQEHANDAGEHSATHWLMTTFPSRRTACMGRMLN